MTANGYTFYRGASMLDGKPIVGIVTGYRIDSKNSKSCGAVLQTFILRQDMDPVEAARTGADASICGDCPHRGASDGYVNSGRSCYVNIGTGVRNVWLAWQRGSYPQAQSFQHLFDLGAGRNVRLGSYGDPAAIPLIYWQALLMRSRWSIGYTHQWRNPRFAELRKFAMASVDEEIDRKAAQDMGWRTFRVRGGNHPLLDREVACPASAEMGKRSSCEECRACGGLGAKARADIAIVVHGPAGRVGNFGRHAMETIAR